MKKILFTICLILPLIFMSCSNKVINENKPNEETNITENNNNPDKNNEIKEEEEQIKNEEESEVLEEIIESETDSPENVEVISPVKPFIDSRFGYLESIYLENGNYYLALDEAEIFFDEEALEEAILDNKAGYQEDGKAFLPNPYYIRNNYDNLSNFKISDDAKFYLCGFALKGDRNDNSINLYEVTLEEFKEFTTKSFFNYDSTRSLRWPVWTDVQDGVAIKLYQQFIP